MSAVLSGRGRAQSLRTASSPRPGSGVWPTLPADRRTFNGLGDVAAAFRDLFAGGNVGKTMIVLDGRGDV